MAKIIIFALLLLLVLVFLVAAIVRGVICAVKRVGHKETNGALSKLRKCIAATAICSAVCILFVIVTQLTAATPPICDDNGNAVEGSIAELRKIELNGRKEWISIRGHSKDNPILLFLAGGPGGTQLAAVRHELSELEESFIVVNWEQPGASKSYTSASKAALTPETYVEDGTALVRYLLNEFQQEKLYLVGESWGSALGIFMIDSNPELYHAFIGTGQMVAFKETEIIDYNLALVLAKEGGQHDLIATLEKNGPPPYYGKDVTWKSAAYLNYLSGIMARNPKIQNGGFNTYRDLSSNEYGIYDKINFLRGIVTTFNEVYPQLYSIDLREDFTCLQVPVYFFLGRHDINAPITLAEEYFELLQSPHKEIVWFEHSGHNPWINESAKFSQELYNIAYSST